MTKRPLAVSYGRSSSAKQRSIDDQLAENRKTVAERSWKLRDELSDPVSASRYGRKVRENWARILDMLPTVDVVVLWEPSRGDRSLGSWAAFLDACRAHGVRVHATSHNRTYDPANARDYRSLAEDGVDSVYESDRQSARIRRGVASAAAAGKAGGPALFGFARTYDPSTGAYVADDENPEQGKIVRELFIAAAKGKTLTSIARELNAAGVPTARGGVQWRVATVRRILAQPAYRPHPADRTRGCRVHAGNTYPAVWPPLTTEAVWQAVQRALGTTDAAQRDRRRSSPPGRVKWLLSGSMKVMTAPCGSQLIGWKGAPGRTAQYRCISDNCVAAPMHECDEYVTQLVVARLSRRDARKLWVVDDSRSKEAADQLARLQGELDEALQLFMTGELSARAYAAKEAAMAPRIKDAEKAAQPSGVPLGVLELINAAQLSRDRVRPTWDGLALPVKREIIANIFSELALGPYTTRLNVWHTPEERLDIVSKRISHRWRRAA
jgi:DNA invertase Pin-like site-specific DNA recombinase